MTQTVLIPSSGNPSLAPPPAVRRRSTIVLAAGALAALAAVGVLCWYGGLRNRFFPENFGVVEPGKIYRSGQISQHVIHDTLVANHIGLIVDLSADDTPDTRAERETAAELGIRRAALTLKGNGTGNPSIYPRAIEEIVNANRDGKIVLVHCQAGAQRTSGIIAAYRILIQDVAQEQAFAEMRKFGHNPSNNPKLIPFLEAHLAEWRAKLQADHLLDGADLTAQPTASR